MCPASPFSSPQHSEAALSFHFCTPLKSFLFRECVQRAMQLSEGYRSTAAQRKLKGLWLLSTDTAQRLELKGGICGLFFFPTRKELSSTTIAPQSTTTTIEAPSNTQKRQLWCFLTARSSIFMCCFQTPCYLLAFTISVWGGFTSSSIKACLSG